MSFEPYFLLRNGGRQGSRLIPGHHAHHFRVPQHPDQKHESNTYTSYPQPHVTTFNHIDHPHVTPTTVAPIPHKLQIKQEPQHPHDKIVPVSQLLPSFPIDSVSAGSTPQSLATNTSLPKPHLQPVPEERSVRPGGPSAAKSPTLRGGLQRHVNTPSGAALHQPAELPAESPYQGQQRAQNIPPSKTGTPIEATHALAIRSRQKQVTPVEHTVARQTTPVERSPCRIQPTRRQRSQRYWDACNGSPLQHATATPVKVQGHPRKRYGGRGERRWSAQTRGEDCQVLVKAHAQGSPDRSHFTVSVVDGSALNSPRDCAYVVEATAPSYNPRDRCRGDPREKRVETRVAGSAPQGGPFRNTPRTAVGISSLPAPQFRQGDFKVSNIPKVPHRGRKAHADAQPIHTDRGFRPSRAHVGDKYPQSDQAVHSHGASHGRRSNGKHGSRGQRSVVQDTMASVQGLSTVHVVDHAFDTGLKMSTEAEKYNPHAIHNMTHVQRALPREYTREGTDVLKAVIDKDSNGGGQQSAGLSQGGAKSSGEGSGEGYTSTTYSRRKHQLPEYPQRKEYETAPKQRSGARGASQERLASVHAYFESRKMRKDGRTDIMPNKSCLQKVMPREATRKEPQINCTPLNWPQVDATVKQKTMLKASTRETQYSASCKRTDQAQQHAKKPPIDTSRAQQGSSNHEIAKQAAPVLPPNYGTSLQKVYQYPRPIADEQKYNGDLGNRKDAPVRVTNTTQLGATRASSRSSIEDTKRTSDQGFASSKSHSASCEKSSGRAAPSRGAVCTEGASKTQQIPAAGKPKDDERSNAESSVRQYTDVAKAVVEEILPGDQNKRTGGKVQQVVRGNSNEQHEDLQLPQDQAKTRGQGQQQFASERGQPARGQPKGIARLVPQYSGEYYYWPRAASHRSHGRSHRRNRAAGSVAPRHDLPDSRSWQVPDANHPRHPLALQHTFLKKTCNQIQPTAIPVKQVAPASPPAQRRIDDSTLYLGSPEVLSSLMSDLVDALPSPELPATPQLLSAPAPFYISPRQSASAIGAEEPAALAPEQAQANTCIPTQIPAPIAQLDTSNLLVALAAACRATDQLAVNERVHTTTTEPRMCPVSTECSASPRKLAKPREQEPTFNNPTNPVSVLNPLPNPLHQEPLHTASPEHFTTHPASQTPIIASSDCALVPTADTSTRTKPTPPYSISDPATEGTPLPCKPQLGKLPPTLPTLSHFPPTFPSPTTCPTDPSTQATLGSSASGKPIPPIATQPPKAQTQEIVACEQQPLAPMRYPNPSDFTPRSPLQTQMELVTAPTHASTPTLRCHQPSVSAAATPKLSTVAIPTTCPALGAVASPACATTSDTTSPPTDVSSPSAYLQNPAKNTLQPPPQMETYSTVHLCADNRPTSLGSSHIPPIPKPGTDATPCRGFTTHANTHWPSSLYTPAHVDIHATLARATRSPDRTQVPVRAQYTLECRAQRTKTTGTPSRSELTHKVGIETTFLGATTVPGSVQVNANDQVTTVRCVINARDPTTGTRTHQENAVTHVNRSEQGDVPKHVDVPAQPLPHHILAQLAASLEPCENSVTPPRHGKAPPVTASSPLSMGAPADVAVDTNPQGAAGDNPIWTSSYLSGSVDPTQTKCHPSAASLDHVHISNSSVCPKGNDHTLRKAAASSDVVRPPRGDATSQKDAHSQPSNHPFRAWSAPTNFLQPLLTTTRGTTHPTAPESPHPQATHAAVDCHAAQPRTSGTCPINPQPIAHSTLTPTRSSTQQCKPSSTQQCEPSESKLEAQATPPRASASPGTSNTISRSLNYARRLCSIAPSSAPDPCPTSAPTTPPVLPSSTAPASMVGPLPTELVLHPTFNPTNQVPVGKNPPQMAVTPFTQAMPPALQKPPALSGNIMSGATSQTDMAPEEIQAVYESFGRLLSHVPDTGGNLLGQCVPSFPHVTGYCPPTAPSVYDLHPASFCYPREWTIGQPRFVQRQATSIRPSAAILGGVKNVHRVQEIVPNLQRPGIPWKYRQDLAHLGRGGVWNVEAGMGGIPPVRDDAMLEARRGAHSFSECGGGVTRVPPKLVQGHQGASQVGQHVQWVEQYCRYGGGCGL